MVKNLWLLYRAGALAEEKDPQKIEEHRQTFYCGASSLFEFLMDSDREPTENDSKMSAINEELQKFNVEFEAKMRK